MTTNCTICGETMTVSSHNVTACDSCAEAYELEQSTRFKIQFTRTITSSPEYDEVIATSREEARTIFYGNNPTFYVISVIHQ